MDNAESKTNQLKGKLAAFFLQSVGKLPFLVAQVIGALMGYILWLLPSESKHVTEINLRKCFPEKTDSWYKSVGRKSLIQSSIMMLEIAPLWTRPFVWGKQFIVSVDGEELINEAARKNKGILFITPHLGNWELLSQYIASRFQVTAMYRPAKLQAIDKIIINSRSEPGTIMAPTNIRGVKQIKDCLNAGGTTVIFPDQVPHKRGGVHVPFFATSCFTGVLVPRLLRSTERVNNEITPLCIYCHRIGIGKGFEVRVRAVSSDIHSNDATVATTALSQTIESVVLENIEQYQWSYKRFKEEGGPDIYKKSP